MYLRNQFGLNIIDCLQLFIFLWTQLLHLFWCLLLFVFFVRREDLSKQYFRTCPKVRFNRALGKCRLPEFFPGDTLHSACGQVWGFAFLTSVPVVFQHWTIWANVYLLNRVLIDCNSQRRGMQRCSYGFFTTGDYTHFIWGPKQHLNRTHSLWSGPNMNILKTRHQMK